MTALSHRFRTVPPVGAAHTAAGTPEDAPSETADAALVAASLTDPDRFTAVYDRHFPAVYRYVAGRLGPQVADDVAAETFLVAFRRRATFDPAKGEVRPWLFGIATTLVAQHRRAESRRYRALAQLAVERGPGDGADHAAAEGLRLDLARALTKLSRKERDVVLLVALADLSHQGVADALGIPYGTVGSRLSTARRKLRAALNRKGE
ncbi:RNA polymerase sigma factor [Actinomadura kijaniata]|uniref:RNA polymerase sigma-70 factor (ECF subfamily) n=1 Tax=Actinomadura namibiensis TaxID=182080 RepID=A0A7W3LL36_ACTNM|nr:RNA polymerase sigma factor [Actinomadura namibiensis]MBA8950120.1 RNA polymerase sigma-70 factor (ECF subfamily) [Actinomadura namibiensis]